MLQFFFINRMPTPILHGNNPLHLLTCSQPKYHDLRVFGSACFPCLRPYQQHKFDFHTKKCVFVGYNNHHKGYRCFVPSGRIYVSRHVVFNESYFPYPSLFPNADSSPIAVEPSVLTWLPISTSTDLQYSTTSRLPSSTTLPNTLIPNISSTLDTSISEPQTSYPSTSPSPSIALASPTTAPHNLHSMQTRGKAGISKPKQFFGCVAQLDDWSLIEPSTYKPLLLLLFGLKPWMKNLLHLFETILGI